MFRVLVSLSVLFWPTFLSAQGYPLVSLETDAVLGKQLEVDLDPRVRFADTTATDVINLPTTPPPGAVTQAQFKNSFLEAFRPNARQTTLPRTRWEHMEGHAQWTRAALSALKGHGKPLVDLVPADITNWCPAYPEADADRRRAFWVGFLSALAKHESTYRPWAVGGGGKWYGLLQILPGTARGYKCEARTGRALKDGGANLSCAIRIMARTVPRDGVIHGYKNRKGRGVTADWGPMHSAKKRRDMAGWLKAQTYCQPLVATRPKVRPNDPGVGR